MVHTINIKCTNGDKFSVSIDASSTILQLKEAVESTSSIPAVQQRLIYKGHVLKDVRTIESYGIEDSHTVILVRGSAPSSRPAAAPAAPAAAAPTPVPAASAVPPNPFANPMGMGAMGGMDMHSMQQQMMQNPEMMSQIMNSPMMQSLLDNPEIIQNMFQNNPQMQAIIEQNPELAHVLSNPETIRQSMQMARNPELMREMMRNTDRAMSNVEAHPEGFNALRRMYETVQEPMMNAAESVVHGATSRSGSSTTNSTGVSGPVDSAEQPSNEPLPNPWAPRPPAAATAATGAAQQQQPGVGANPATAFNPFLGMMQQQQPQQNGSSPAMGTTGMNTNPMGMDPQLMAQMMQNPVMQQMMSNMMQNPEMLEQAINANPMVRQMMDANPQMREMLRNPAVLQLFTPQNMQAMMQMQSAMAQLQNSLGGMQVPLNPAASTAPPASSGAGQQPQQQQQSAPNPMANFQSLLAAMGSGGSGGMMGPSPAQPPVRPEVTYQSQLQQLNEMGFTDAQANINALLMTGGNVQAAIERLLLG